jgi:hypothetical protein
MLTMRHHLRDRNEIPAAFAHELVGEEMTAALRIHRLGAHGQQSDPSCPLGAALRALSFEAGFGDASGRGVAAS